MFFSLHLVRLGLQIRYAVFVLFPLLPAVYLFVCMAKIQISQLTLCYSIQAGPCTVLLLCMRTAEVDTEIGLTSRDDRHTFFMKTEDKRIYFPLFCPSLTHKQHTTFLSLDIELHFLLFPKYYTCSCLTIATVACTSTSHRGSTLKNKI